MSIEVSGIGLANVDLISNVSDIFLQKFNLKKNGTTLLSPLEFGRLVSALEHYERYAGGSMANVLCGLSALGVKTRFFGKLGDDGNESLYRRSFKDYNVAYNTTALEGAETSQCITLISKDGDRSFAYTKEASWHLKKDEIDFDIIAESRLLMMEIYAFGFDEENNMALNTINHAANHKTDVILTMIDGSFGHGFFEKIKGLDHGHKIAMIIENEENLIAFTGCPDLDAVFDMFKDWNADLLVTRADETTRALIKGRDYHIKPPALDSMKNTYGAGDQFLAGFIFALLDDQDPETAIKFGHQKAKEIIEQPYARPLLSEKFY